MSSRMRSVNAPLGASTFGALESSENTVGLGIVGEPSPKAANTVDAGERAKNNTSTIAIARSTGAGTIRNIFGTMSHDYKHQPATPDKFVNHSSIPRVS